MSKGSAQVASNVALTCSGGLSFTAYNVGHDGRIFAFAFFLMIAAAYLRSQAD